MDSVEPVAAAASFSAAAPAASNAVPGAAAAAPPAQVAAERAADGNAMAAAGQGPGLDTSREVSYPRFVMAPPQQSWQQQQQPLPQQQFQQVEDDEEASLMGRRRGEGAAAWAAKQVQCQNSSSSKDGGVEGDLSDIVHIQVPEHGTGWKKLLAYVGPGFLVAIAYIDPANFESDLQAGAQYKYSLLWVLLLASLGGLLIQSLCANLGIVTGKHLAEHCRLEYPKAMRLALWIIAEVEIIASDIPEVIGTAFALNILFGLKLWIGVVATGFSTIGLLAIQRYGIRWLELFIGLLVMVIAVCFFVEMAEAPVSWPAVARGMFVPVLQDMGATAIAISLVGAVVMPHNLFLHSALVLSRKLARTEKAVKDGCHYCFVEVSIALVVAFAINVAVICVGSAVCNTDSANAAADIAQNEVVADCKDITLNNAHILLQNTLGPWASTVFGVALLASGQSSTVTGTYAGQYVMAGFLDLRMKTWLRNLITRLAAIVPSLAVALLGGSKGAGQLIIISSMVLSFGLPYALIPLLKFTSTSQKMGPFANTVTVTAVTWVVGFLVIAVNCYFVIDVLRQWTASDAESSVVAGVVLPLLLLLLVLLYVASLIFLALRPNQVTTYDESPAAHCTWLSTSNRPASPTTGAATAGGFAAAGGDAAGAAVVGGGEEGLQTSGASQSAGGEEESERTGLLLGAGSTSDKG